MNQLANKVSSFLSNEASPASENAKISMKHYFLALLGLIICALAVQFYQIETSLHFPKLFPIVVVAFLVHSLLPFKYKQLFLFLTNITAIIILFGLTNGSIIILIASFLFFILQLPIKIIYRSILTIFTGILLALGKIGWLPGIDLSIPSTIVGNLFMFRTILYLYEIRHEKVTPSLISQLNYFFLLPNLIFTIFPVVDYKTFTRNFYDKPAYQNYFKGLHWIMRGLLHLMIYRLIYYYLLPSPLDINSFSNLVLYMVVSYVLIIRLSGIFHLSVGIICLFGYNLPPTFNNYFLASSFSDIWRRINIYWKDFIMKVFYYPIFFKFKKRNNTAIFVTIIIIFLINWMLHQYQWFWIRGNFPIRMIDFIFWLLFGVLVALNSIYQRKKKKQQPISTGFNVRHSFIKTLKIIGMFSFMSILWSFWTSPTIETWIFLLKLGFKEPSIDILILLTSLAGLSIFGVLLFYISHKWKQKSKNPIPFLAIKTYSILWITLAFLASPPIRPVISQYFSYDFSPVLEMRLNKFDEDQLFKGYYESLLVGNNFSSRMWEVQKEEQPEKSNHIKSLKEGDMLEQDIGLLDKKLKPNKSILFKGVEFSTNSFGMRDRSYSLIKDEKTLRIALLGGSNEMGAGVRNSETFENIVEDELNRQNDWAAFDKIEILNFSISAIHMPQQVAISEQRVLNFKPNILIYCIHPEESRKSLKSFAKLMKKPFLSDYPRLEQIYQESKIQKETTNNKKQVLLKPFQDELMEWGISRISETCKENKIVPVCLFLPVLKESPESSQEDNEALLNLFKQKGFITINLSSAFDNKNKAVLKVSEWDRHYNVEGHQIIADELLFEIKKNIDLENALLIGEK